MYNEKWVGCYLTLFKCADLVFEVPVESLVWPHSHLLLSKGVTKSGINVRLWVERILAVHRSLLRSKGPAFVNEKGEQSTTSDMNDLFIELLISIYDRRPELFGYDIESAADLQDKFNVFRSFRRGCGNESQRGRSVCG